jgi:hypothetical protein
MPFQVLIVLIILAIIAILILFAVAYDQDEMGYIVAMIYPVLVIAGASTWMGLAWNQQTLHIKYVRIHMFKNQDEQGRQMQFIVDEENNHALININAKFGGIAPPGAVVQVFRRNPHSGGIHWHNSITTYHLITPADDGYEVAVNDLPPIKNPSIIDRLYGQYTEQRATSRRDEPKRNK